MMRCDLPSPVERIEIDLRNRLVVVDPKAEDQGGADSSSGKAASD